MELMELSKPQHRERAIDVPESFVGVIKQAPRYPPPQPRTSLRSNDSSNHGDQQVDAYYQQSLHQQQLNHHNHQHHHPHHNNNNNNINNQLHHSKMVYDPDIIIQHYQERLSLRGSKKLQHLANHNAHHQHQPTNNNSISANGNLNEMTHAIVNSAFESDELEHHHHHQQQQPQQPQHSPNQQSFSSSHRQVPLPDFCAVLDRLLEHVHDSRLAQLISQTGLQRLLHIYGNIMQQPSPNDFSNSLSNVSLSDLTQQTIILLQSQANMSSETAELLNLLSKFELDGLCAAFDKIHHNRRVLGELHLQQQQHLNVQSPFANGLHQSHMEVDEMKVDETLLYDDRIEGSLRIVHLQKENCEPLGATIKNQPDGSVVIARIVKGGVAEKSGLLQENDEIIGINGIKIEERNVNLISDMLAEMNGSITFILASRDHGKMSEPVRMTTPSVTHLRALFDYDPEEDIYIPCRELGICFNKGDIIHVIDRTDTYWWQAYKQGEHEQSLAGLVPSIHLQLQREAMKQSLLNDSIAVQKHSSTRRLLLCGSKRSKRKDRDSANTLSFEETLTYEEVHLYYPHANFKRPIVLIGPTNIGRHELRQRIMLDTERFAAAVPHTSRSRRDGEMDGVDYHFISRNEFELHIKQGKFVEHGQYEGNYYGTSLGAIEAVVQSGKICVLNLHVHSIHVLRQGPAGAKLKPYFVFVAPPTQLDRLNKLITSTTHYQQLENCSISPNDLQAIIEEAREIESKYGHYFDMVLTMTDIDRAFNELMRDINALEREPQWIPKSWRK